VLFFQIKSFLEPKLSEYEYKDPPISSATKTKFIPGNINKNQNILAIKYVLRDLRINN